LLGESHNDLYYSISKVNDPEFFVVMDTEEINRFPNFTEAIETGGNNGRPVPRGEWNALNDLLVNQKQCYSNPTNGNCYVKPENRHFQ